MANERKKDSGIEILGAAILLLLLALLCHFHIIICPLPTCPEGQITCQICPGNCCLPDGSCPCPEGSAPCSIYCPQTLNCPSNCCNIDSCVCTAIPECPPYTSWSESRGCCVYTTGLFIGQCASLCTTDPLRIGGCTRGIDACDSNGCCPLGSIGWDSKQNCCVDSDGVCMTQCIVDSTRSTCPIVFVGGCDSTGCCPTDTYWSSKLSCCVYSNSEICYDSCMPPLVYDSVLKCCLDPETSTCSVNCPEGTTYDSSQNCCTYVNTNICYGLCSDPLVYDSSLGCCVDPLNPSECVSYWTVQCPNESIGWDEDKQCCIDSFGNCIHVYICTSNSFLVGCPPNVGECPSNGCCPPLAIGWDSIKKCCVDINNNCISESCTNPEVCSALNRCCPGFGCYGGECRPCDEFTCTDTKTCDCPLGCNCAGTGQSCINCINPSSCSYDSDCCCNYKCINGNCIYSDLQRGINFVDCKYTGTVGTCEKEIICENGCVNNIQCIDPRLPEGQCVSIAGSCNSSSDCCCGYSCQIINGNKVCCPGGLWTCYLE